MLKLSHVVKYRQNQKSQKTNSRSSVQSA